MQSGKSSLLAAGTFDRRHPIVSSFNRSDPEQPNHQQHEHEHNNSSQTSMATETTPTTVRRDGHKGRHDQGKGFFSFLAMSVRAARFDFL